MAGYSVGDRVEVLWQGELFAAEVIRTPSPDTVDVVYEIDGTVGEDLTAEGHGLRLLPDRNSDDGDGGEHGGSSAAMMPKGNASDVGDADADEEDEDGDEGEGGKKTRMCSVDDCTKAIHGRGLCQSHGRKPCLVDGCSTNAVARGVCGKHGAMGKCSVSDCSTNATNKGGFCARHGGKDGFCTAPGCVTPAIPGKGVCTKHGGGGNRKPCSVDGCTANAQARGLCKKHGAYGKCSVNDCSTNAQNKGGFCGGHGGRKRKPCSVAGCSTKEQARGLCGKHGARGKCNVSDCSTNATTKDGFCARHGGKDGFCTTPGCDTPSIPGKGVCTKHGGGGSKNPF